MANLSAYYPLPIVSGTTLGTFADGASAAHVGQANTFSANQNFSGTNSVAPNQTAASGSSLMTRDLVEKRWSKWFSAGELADFNVTTSGKFATNSTGNASGHPFNAFLVTIPNAGSTSIIIPVPWQTVGQIRAISYWTDRGNTNSGVAGDIAVWTKPQTWSVTTNSQTRVNPTGTQIQTVFTANYGGGGQARYYIVDQTVDFGTVSGIDGADPLQIKTVDVQRRATDATDTSNDVIYLAGVHLIAV